MFERNLDEGKGRKIGKKEDEMEAPEGDRKQPLRREICEQKDVGDFCYFCQKYLLCCCDELLPATATMMMSKRRRQILLGCLQDICALALHQLCRTALERFFVVVCDVRRFYEMDGVHG